MIKISRNIIILFIMLSSLGCKGPIEQVASWPEVSNETKPWTRWWWHGSAVTKEGITAELEAYEKAGMGGVELTPIFGVIGEEENNIDYLSSEWVDLLVFTLEEAERLGLGVDMATGTGWPFGGPWIQKDNACKYVAHQTYRLEEGQRLKQKVTFVQKPILRNVGNAMVQIYNVSEKDFNQVQEKLQDPNFKFELERLTFDQVIDPVSENKNLQVLALDQVRFEEKLPLIVLMAYNGSGEKLDLTEQLDDDGTLDWTAPSGTWTLHALFEGYHGKMVERAAPGGEGNVIDHFSEKAISRYLEKYDTAFEGRNIGPLRSFFNDSYEVDDAQGQANWTPEFLKEFEDKKGYSLTDYLDVLYGPDSTEIHQRLLSDIREVFSDLLLERFTRKWGEWAHNKGAMIRNQAHGSPANILDLYAESDIPETEGEDIIRAKFATSAGNVSGKQLISSESATWLDEHFQADLGDLKQNVDRYFVSGVNHIFYHGTTYTPSGESWPGRLFYAAIHANPRNTLWQNFPAFNEYVTRVQSVLQQGIPGNDILLYFPVYDRYATPGIELLTHFDAHGPELEAMPFKETADQLLKSGYAFDFISDSQIQKLQLEHNELRSGNTSYKTILIPETKYMPLETLQKIAELVEQGAKVIFVEDLPKDVPGLSDIDNRREALAKLKSNFQFSRDKNGLEKSSLGNGTVLKGIDISTMLGAVGIEREKMVDTGLSFTKRIIDGQTYYFIANWSGNTFEDWVYLSGEGQSIEILDPLTGTFGMAKVKSRDNDLGVYLQLSRGSSVILKLNSEQVNGDEWNYYKKSTESTILDDGWSITFINGGNKLPALITESSLKPWTSIAGDDYAYFSGTANYSCSFANSKSPGLGYLLDLGQVGVCAEVRVNDQYVGTLFGPDFKIFIDQSLIKAENKLDILVTNNMTNRIIDLERRNIFWKKFYNINFPSKKRENLGKYRIFDISRWNVVTSGLTGPVVLTKVENLD